MSKIFDLRSSGGELIILGTAIVLPSSSSDDVVPITGSMRHNPEENLIEAYIGGSWKSVINQGGVIAPHTHQMSEIVGLVTALAGKAPTIHNHGIEQVDGLQAALDGKSPVGHTHALGISDIANLSSQLTSMQTQINGKANTSDIPASETKYESIQACFPNRPYASATLLWTAGYDCVFPANFANSFGNLEAKPTDSYVITVWKNAAQVGTITISPSGVFTFATTNGQVISVLRGEALRFVASATPDPTIRTISFTTLATRTS